MEREALTELAIRVAGSFPAVTRGQPFGEGTEVFKVVGKVFALVNLGDRPACLTLKCAPPHARSLVAGYESIIPGYHVNKQHWISIVAGEPEHPAAGPDPAPDIDETLVEDLIGNSYDIVVSLLPRDRRPVDPHAAPSTGTDTGASASTDASASTGASESESESARADEGLKSR